MAVQGADRIQAPFSRDVLDALLMEQSKPVPVPTLCENDKSVLRVSVDGYSCTFCGFKQDWAYDPNW